MSTLRINNIEAQSIPASPTIDEKVKVTNSSGDILVNIDGKTSGITTIGINTTDGNIKFDANSNVLITGILTATTLAGNFTPDSLEIGSNIKLGNAGVGTFLSINSSTSPNLIIKDGTTEKGYIGFNANDPFIGRKNGVGVAFQNNKIRPVDGDDGSGSNNTVDIGENTYKFKDAYFSGTVTANSYAGDGSNLTGIDATKIITGNTQVQTIDTGSDGHIKFTTEGSERLRIDSAGNMGLGITPDTQGGTVVSLQIGSATNLYNETSDDYTILGNNVYFDGTNNKYIKTQQSSRLMQNAGEFTFQQAASGSADANITYTTPFKIRSDGKISTGTSINTSNTYEFSVTGADGTGCFYAHGRNHYLSNRSNAYASLTLKKANADSDGTDYLQLRDSSNALKLSLSGDGSINGDSNSVKVKVSSGERLRVNSGSVWVIGGTSGMPTSSSGARLQVGAHTFTGSNHVYHTSRLGIQNNGSLTCISNCSTYTDVTYPGYGFVMVQGASTSDYNTFGICPDSPQTGSDLNFHAGYRKSNIHSDANVRQMWLNFNGQVYKRDNGANWNQTSDERLKKNIVDSNIGLAEIKQLRITSFEYRKADEIDMSLFPKANDPLQVIIEGEEGPHTGVIAQEIESVLPECVKTSDKGAKTVQADAITWALVNAVKELSAKNEALEARVAALEGS